MADTARSAGRSGAARTVVLVGWAAKGVVYLALAWLVLQLALGSAQEEASTQGALQQIAGTGPGGIALVLVGVGLLAYAVGRVLEVTTLATPQIDTKDRVQAAVLAVVYLSLGLTALGVAGSGGGGSEEEGSSFLLGLPGGRVLVGLLALAVVAAGVWSAKEGLQQAFLPTLRTSEMPPGVRALAGRLGTVAYVTKGAVLALVGVFLMRAALQYDAQEARGLDASLREVAEQGWGRPVLVAVALGVLAYALFAFLEARWRRVGVSATGTA